jgi:hypothetical protein
MWHGKSELASSPPAGKVSTYFYDMGHSSSVLSTWWFLRKQHSVTVCTFFVLQVQALSEGGWACSACSCQCAAAFHFTRTQHSAANCCQVYLQWGYWPLMHSAPNVHTEGSLPCNCKQQQFISFHFFNMCQTSHLQGASPASAIHDGGLPAVLYVSFDHLCGTTGLPAYSLEEAGPWIHVLFSNKVLHSKHNHPGRQRSDRNPCPAPWVLLCLNQI